MSTSSAESISDIASDDASVGPDPKRWLALGVIAIAQLMIVLDASIVNIALPSAQRDLGITDANRQWVVTAYTLAFGGLLLLGGRIADYSGRKRIFIIGLLGFAGASALGGISQNGAMLFAARALQGAFAALLAPAALSLITVTFTEAKERARAFGVYGAISGGGAAIGLILGGVLTEYASWRWCLLVNVPIALIAAGLAIPFVRESRAHGNTSYDIPGAVTVTVGLVALVYGFTKAGTPGIGWTAGVTVASLVLAAVLLDRRSSSSRRARRNPLLPLRVVSTATAAAPTSRCSSRRMGLFGMFLFLTYYFQGTLGYSALKSGFAFLPFSLGIIVSAGIASQLLPRIGPALARHGRSRVSGARDALADPDHADDDLRRARAARPWCSSASAWASSSSRCPRTALFGIGEHDAGVGSALLNSTQQIGGSLGTALLNTIAATATASYLVANQSPSAGPGRSGARLHDGLLGRRRLPGARRSGRGLHHHRDEALARAARRRRPGRLTSRSRRCPAADRQRGTLVSWTFAGTPSSSTARTPSCWPPSGAPCSSVEVRGRWEQYVGLHPMAPGQPRLVLQRTDDPRPTKNTVHVDLHVPSEADLQPAVDRATALGATLVQVFDDGAHWRTLADPEGNLFCLVAD